MVGNGAAGGLLWPSPLPAAAVRLSCWSVGASAAVAGSRDYPGRLAAFMRHRAITAGRLLNPYVYLDTVVLIGSVGIRQPAPVGPRHGGRASAGGGFAVSGRVSFVRRNYRREVETENV